MPDYCFTIESRSGPPESVNEAFPDAPTACREAVLLLGDMLREDPGALLPAGRLQVRVSIGDGSPLFELSLDAVQVRPPTDG